MIDIEQIGIFFGSAAGIWAVGFAWGKANAWLRSLVNAA